MKDEIFQNLIKLTNKYNSILIITIILITLFFIVIFYYTYGIQDYYNPYNPNSKYYLSPNFEKANVDNLKKMYEIYLNEANYLLSINLYYPAYDYVLKLSHIFNLLDSRSAIGPIERNNKLADIRSLAKKCALLYIQDKTQHNITSNILSLVK